MESTFTTPEDGALIVRMANARAAALRISDQAQQGAYQHHVDKGVEAFEDVVVELAAEFGPDGVSPKGLANALRTIYGYKGETLQAVLHKGVNSATIEHRVVLVYDPIDMEARYLAVKAEDMVVVADDGDWE